MSKPSARFSFIVNGSRACTIAALTVLLAAPRCLPQTAGIPDAGNPGLPINGAFSGATSILCNSTMATFM